MAWLYKQLRLFIYAALMKRNFLEKENSFFNKEGEDCHSSVGRVLVLETRGRWFDSD